MRWKKKSCEKKIRTVRSNEEEISMNQIKMMKLMKARIKLKKIHNGTKYNSYKSKY